MFGKFARKQYDFYIAGQMKGVANGNKDMFDRAASFLRSQGYSVWSPAEQNDRDSTFNQCMINDINAVIHLCKAIVLLPGWGKSLGANTEALCAYVCGKPIFFVKTYSEYMDKSSLLVLVKAPMESFVKRLVLPFNPSHKNFRQLEEMNIPEEKVLKV